MNRWRRMIIRSYLPAATVVVLAMLAQVALGWLGTPAAGGLQSAVQWVSVVGLLLGIAMLSATTYGLLRWNSGHGRSCSACAGLLGRKRIHQGKSYRRCLACAKKNARRRYAYNGPDGQLSG